jgi:hypothetical protein
VAPVDAQLGQPAARRQPIVDETVDRLAEGHEADRRVMRHQQAEQDHPQPVDLVSPFHAAAGRRTRSTA